jgi:purine-binding chemotaxis protein CheW
VDPLEELFNVPLEIATATEESYHQALDKSTEEKGNLRQLLTFSLGDEEYALDIEAIREIIKPREVTDLPRVPDFILGLISLRGIIIPIYDLSQRMRLGKSVITPASRVIVCQCEDRVFGLLVDSISQVMRLPNQNIEPPPAVLSGIDRDLVEGVGRYQGKMMILLHLPCVADTELL